jgi:hypothetical protein
VPDESQAEGQPAQESDKQPAATDGAVTSSGYSYTVVDEGAAVAHASGSRGGVHPLLLVAAAIVPAVIVGVAVWFFAASGSGDKTRVNADVSNVVNAFSQAQGTTATRYEGKVAPGYPGDIPLYPGAKLISSVLQIRGEDASYLVIYDTHDKRDKVSAYYQDKLAADPFQVDAAQDSRDSALHQFSKIDDANIRGLVLTAGSNDDRLTTIVVSLQVTSGAKAQTPARYDPGVAKTLPDGFPNGVPPYPDAVLIETGFQKQAGASTFIVSFVTKDEITKVMDYYRGKFKDGGLTVTDGDATQSALVDATVVQFTDDKQTLGGQVTAGRLAEDKNYTRIDLQVRATKQPS